MKTLFVLNPQAGKNRRRPHLRHDLARFIREHRLDAAVALTEGPGHATQLARGAVQQHCGRVVAVGGDGTMNEVAQGLVGTRTELALVPCGSGNGLALHLRLPTRFDQALALMANPTARSVAIDTGTANGHPFFNAMGVGFDAEISRRFNRLTRRGLPAYIRTVAGALGSFRPEAYAIEAGGRAFELRASLIAVANSDQYGNHALIAPRASVIDGELDLVALPPVGFLGSASLAARLFAGSIDRYAGVVRCTGEKFIIHRERPGLLHTDGETHDTAATVRIAVRPASLRLVVPAATAQALARNRPATRAIA